MSNNLKDLLGEFLSEEDAEPIVARFKQMGLTLKVNKMKGRVHREVLNKLIKERGNMCICCKGLGDRQTLTVDHIIPKKMLLDMGLEEFFDDETNLDVLCKDCNVRKGSQLDFSNAKTIVQLEKYVDIYKERHGLD